MIAALRLLVPLLPLLTACGKGSETAVSRDTDTGTPVLRGALRLAFPVAHPETISLDFVAGVDHDPTEYKGTQQAICTDHAGRHFPWCYDQHTGSDFILDGGFTTMDAGSTEVIAADRGTVVETDDGHYDRCHADLGKGANSCDGYPMEANYVIVEHPTGHRTKYWHFKQGSVAGAVGQEGEIGTVLGLIGSSGNSSTPHLHFELVDADDTVIDPYSGPCSQPETWWCDQGPDDGLPGPCP